MNKVLVIVGPTGIGKTSFGIKCSSLFNGEIISGDSIQIYKDLNIGSAKPTLKEQEEAIHHLINIKEADGSYSVKEFQDLSRELIKKISDNDKLPIIVGGTGLYIKACLYDYTFFDEEEDDNKYEELSNEDIYNLLKEKDPKALDSIHINNRRRLVRALNIFEKHNEGISEIKDSQVHKPIYDIKIIGLTKNREELYKDIEVRCKKMLDEGLIDEIKSLLDKGITFDNQSMRGIGYKEYKDYFEGNKSLDECLEDVIRNTKHFIKRQYTWFNNQFEDMKWYEDRELAIKDIKEWLNI